RIPRPPNSQPQPPPRTEINARCPAVRTARLTHSPRPSPITTQTSLAEQAASGQGSGTHCPSCVAHTCPRRHWIRSQGLLTHLPVAALHPWSWGQLTPAHLSA